MRHPCGHRSLSQLLAFGVLCLAHLTFGLGQTPGGDRLVTFPLGGKESGRWQRVSTENGFVSDVDSQSLVIGKDRSINARFRMSFAKAERLTTSPAKYKTREDTIQFDAGERRYRIIESNYLDGSGKIVASSAATDWKPLRFGLGSRMFDAAVRLSPFGAWRVISYRYANGEPASTDDPPDLRNLIRSHVLLGHDRFVAGKQTCLAPLLEARTITDEEYSKRVGSPFKAIGIPSNKVDAIFVTCDAEGNFPSNTFMLRKSDGKIAMLWNGVFLELEKSQ